MALKAARALSVFNRKLRRSSRFRRDGTQRGLISRRRGAVRARGGAAVLHHGEVPRDRDSAHRAHSGLCRADLETVGGKIAAELAGRAWFPKPFITMRANDADEMRASDAHNARYAQCLAPDSVDAQKAVNARVVARPTEVAICSVVLLDTLGCDPLRLGSKTLIAPAILRPSRPCYPNSRQAAPPDRDDSESRINFPIVSNRQSDVVRSAAVMQCQNFCPKLSTGVQPSQGFAQEHIYNGGGACRDG
ncbi:hypothetical protein DFH09DRAFT_1073152 [Mycena vulgaris]|nr:hypothetical protein DFH09DRAFT_1073152 [Mycena vulgaris]